VAQSLCASVVGCEEDGESVSCPLLPTTAVMSLRKSDEVVVGNGSDHGAPSGWSRSVGKPRAVPGRPGQLRRRPGLENFNAGRWAAVAAC